MYASATDGVEAPGFPTLAEIQSSGLVGGEMNNDHCGSVQACLWTSVADRVTMNGNGADQCYDVCFDVEGGAHHLFTSDHAVNCSTSCFSSFFTGYQNTFAVDQVDDCSEFLHVFNSSVVDSYVQDLTIENSVYNCPTGAIAFYLEATQGTHFRSNRILNGTIALPTYESAFAWDDNDFKWTVPVPTAAANGGQPSYGGGGMVIPNVQDGSYVQAFRNRIYSTVPQTVPCIDIGISNPNGGQIVTVDGNTCQGWANAIAAVNSGGHLPDTLNLRNNQLDNCNINVTAGGWVQTNFGNYVGSTGAPCN